jgi:hypothetical protein
MQFPRLARGEPLAVYPAGHQQAFSASDQMRTMLMRGILRVLGAIAVAAAMMQPLANSAQAQAQAEAAVPTKQIKLTEKQVQGFISAQKKMASAQVEAEAEAIAKENGFAGLDEIDDVEANILLIMGSIDPQTRVFSEPPILITRRIDEVTADAAMSEADKKQVLKELADALKVAKPIQFTENVELVKKYYDSIRAALE